MSSTKLIVLFVATLLFAAPVRAQVNPIDLVGCRREISPFDAKKDGFVWKESDTKKNSKGQKVAVALFPRKIAGQLTAYPKKFKKVELWKNGKRLSKLRFVYHWPEDRSPRRGVYRTEIAPKKLPLYPVLKADGNCFVLPNPRKRID